MKTTFLKLIPFFFSFVFIVSCTTEKVVWPEPTGESKPWTRWWWMENAVDRENIKRELKEMADAGIGGVEITPIYGVKGEEERFIEFLSPGFSDMLKFTIEEADQLGIGVDLPPGSGWRCGGPFVPEEKGLWSLRIQKKELKKGETWQLPDDIQNVAAVSFVKRNGENEESIVVNPTEKFTAPENGVIYMAQRLKNRDMVKRPSKGGEGWAIDTFNEEITEWYLDEFWKRLGVDEGKLRCFFHDSFEYTGDFTTHFTEEFKKRRGYDLAEYLYVLAGDCDDAEMVARVKSDYRETLSDLVLESFIQPMTNWANLHKSLNRNQAHGSPGNILDLYAACDIPETEIFRYVEPGTVDVFVNKFASSAAHVTGQKLVSSESFTWLDEHWTVTSSDMVRAINRFFLSGINHMFFHGTCYSPQDAEWPGWLFYASTQVNNRNPLWREMPALFKYIERTQTILQQSQPQNDLLVYWPYFDVAASDGRLFNHLGVNKDAGWFMEHPISGLSERLSEEGYTFDYISDKQLLDCNVADGGILTSGNARYKAVVVPKTKYIPLETLRQLQQLMEKGGKVFFDEHLPESVPGMAKLAEREKELTTIKEKISEEKWVGNPVGLLASSTVLGEKSLSAQGFHFLKIKNNNENWYLVFNCGLEPVDTWVELSSPAKSYVFLDPLNGEISKAAKKGKSVRIQLDPERAVFVKCSGKKVEAPDFLYRDKQPATELKGVWSVEFLTGGPVLPGKIQMENLVSWTKTSDAETERFAGTARYSVEFDWNENTQTASLNLGDVKDCAHVFLNGKDFGALPGPAFRITVNNLRNGKNRLEVEVTNVAGNRIRDLDIRGVEWRRFYDINLVNIEYQPFDASGWEIKDGGLIGPVTLTGL